MKRLFILHEPDNKISCSSDLFLNIKKINIDYSQENFIVFCLNTKNQVIDAKVIHIGGLNACIVDPKTIFRYALLNNATSIIIAHNHPSGDLAPSSEDKNVFNDLKKVGDLLLLRVLDSIIFNKKEYYSLRGE